MDTKSERCDMIARTLRQCCAAIAEDIGSRLARAKVSENSDELADDNVLRRYADSGSNGTENGDPKQRIV